MEVYHILKTGDHRVFADFLYFPKLKDDTLDTNGLVFVCENDGRADYKRKTPYVKNDRWNTLIELLGIIAGCDEMDKVYQKESNGYHYYMHLAEISDEAAKRWISDIQRIEDLSKNVDSTLKEYFPEPT